MSSEKIFESSKKEFESSEEFVSSGIEFVSSEKEFVSAVEKSLDPVKSNFRQVKSYLCPVKSNLCPIKKKSTCDTFGTPYKTGSDFLFESETESEFSGSESLKTTGLNIEVQPGSYFSIHTMIILGPYN